MFEITINGVNMVENDRTTERVEIFTFTVLLFLMNLGWSQFAYLELRKTRSSFSIPLDIEIAKVACIIIWVSPLSF